MAPLRAVSVLKSRFKILKVVQFIKLKSGRRPWDLMNQVMFLPNNAMWKFSLRVMIRNCLQNKAMVIQLIRKVANRCLKVLHHIGLFYLRKVLFRQA